MKRAAALVGAVAMIGLALLARSVIDDDDGGGGGGRDGDAIVVACPAELLEVCERWALADAVEVVQGTMQELVAGSRDDVDAWLAPGVWVDAARSVDDPTIGEPSRAVARAKVGVAVDVRHHATLEEDCGGEVTWSCLGERRSPAVALLDPESALGLPVLGAAAVGFFDTSDFASNDFDADLDDWLEAFESGPRNAVSQLIVAIGTYSAVAATDADLAAARTRSDRVVVLYPPPEVFADVVLAPAGSRISDEERDDLAGHELREAFDEVAGWSTSVSGDDDQPRGGVLAALLARWQETR